MTRTEAESLLVAYPHCQAAVAYVEHILCVPPAPGLPTSWSLLTSASPPLSPGAVLRFVRAAIEDSMESGLPGHFPLALRQTEHPSFLLYIQGKLGAY